MPSQDEQVPLPQNDTIPLQDNETLSTTVEEEQSVANASLNPFLTMYEPDLATDGVDHNVSLPSVKDLITTQPTVPPPTYQAPLPPIPPRQKSFIKSLEEPIRIPMHLVRSKKAEPTETKPNNVDNISSANVTQSKPVAVADESSQLNGNGYINGDMKPIDLNNHEPSCCPCKSGAHPKNTVNKCQQNGNGVPVTPARKLGKFKYIDFFHITINQCLYYFVCMPLCYLDRLPLPAKGDEVSVIPTHLLSADHIYVQLSEYNSKFEDVQFNMLQKIRPKPLTVTPSM